LSDAAAAAVELPAAAVAVHTTLMVFRRASQWRAARCAARASRVDTELTGAAHDAAIGSTTDHHAAAVIAHGAALARTQLRRTQRRTHRSLRVTALVWRTLAADSGTWAAAAVQERATAVRDLATIVLRTCGQTRACAGIWARGVAQVGNLSVAHVDAAGVGDRRICIVKETAWPDPGFRTAAAAASAAAASCQ
jgi:hypothetical protein